jgi:tRNA-specific 2-thiouridylase
MARVAVLMSGGVDSAGAALILKEQGHKVEGFTARLWESTGVPLDGVASARETCRALGIPHSVIDLRTGFRREVLEPFVSGYLDGKTPNPCAYCNRDIKLGRLAALIRKRGFDFIATGHYARVGRVGGRYTFCEPLDRHKSQVYFLSLVRSGVLGSLMLPLGEYRKDDVRGLLKDAGIPAARRDSQDLCFVAGGRYHDLLCNEGYLPRRGEVLDSEGNVVGKHKGHAAYTPGQRFGLRGKRYYVIGKYPDTNTIVIGSRGQALKREIAVSGINLFLPLPAESAGDFSIRYRYNSAPVAAGISGVRADRLTVVTEEPCFAPAPGQVLAGYTKDCLVFGGLIERCQVN